MFWFLIAIAVFAVYILKFFWNRIHYWQHWNIPSPPCHWLFGHTGAILNGLFSFNTVLYKYYRQYSKLQVPFVGLRICGRLGILVTNAQLTKSILTKDFSYFQNRGLYHNPDDLSSNLITLDYVKWKELRAKVSPAFSNGKLKYMCLKCANVARQLVDVLDGNANKSNGIVDVRNLMLRFTIDIIGSCAFGIQANCLSNPHNEFLKIPHQQSMGQGNSQLAKLLILCFPNAARLLRLKYMPKHLTEFYTRFVNEIVTSREQLQIRHNDFMDTLIDMRNNDGTKVTLKEITSNSLLFFQAGYETSAFTLSFILYELARHHDVQQKARLEICRVMRDCNNVLTYECLSQMKYLGQIVKETLRLYPVSPTLVRQCTKDYTISEYPNFPAFTIRKGQTVVISAYSLHRDDQYFSQPEQFNPDNFAEDNLHSNVFLSFGDGPRNCIGMRFANMQILTGLVLLLQNFTFEFCEKTEDPITFKAASVLLSPQNEIYLKVKKYTLHED